MPGAISRAIPSTLITDSTTTGRNLVTLPNAGAVTYLRVNADNTISALSASAFLAAIGGGSGSSPLTTKGDLYTYSTLDARLAVGTNGQVLSADSSTTTGLKWIAGSVTIGSTSLSLGGTATTLAGLTSVTSTSFVGALTGNASTVTDGAYLSAANVFTAAQSIGDSAINVVNLTLTHANTASNVAMLNCLSGSTSVFNVTKNAVTASVPFTGSLTGNATTATTLATARTINGVSFDGSANITVTAAGSTLSDTVTIAKGGTGLTALGTAGQFIRVNSGATGLEYATVSGTGTVTSVAGTGTVNGLTLTGTVTTSGSLTLGGTLSGVSLSSAVTGTLPVANGGTAQTTTPAVRTAFGVDDVEQADKWTDIGAPANLNTMQTGESAAIYESSTIRIWFTGVTAGNSSIYYSESTDEGATFSSPTKIIGHGSGGVTNHAARGNIYKSGSTYYHFSSDDTGTSGYGGNIQLCTSTSPGSGYTLSGTVIAIPSGARCTGDTGYGYGYASTRIYKSGSTYYLFAEGFLGSSNQEAVWLYTSSSLTSGWTIANGGVPLWTMSYSGQPNITGLSYGEQVSPGCVILSGDTYYAWPWESNVTSPGLFYSEVWCIRTKDPTFVNWTKPKRVKAISAAELSAGQTQWADVWVMEGNSKCWMFSTQVNGSAAGIHLFRFDGPMADLVADRTDATQIFGQPVQSGTLPINRDVLQYQLADDGTLRGYNLVQPFTALATPVTLGTVAVSGATGGYATDANGTYTWFPNNGTVGTFVRTGHATLYYTGTGNTWRVSDSGAVDRYEGTGTSPFDPTGTYSTNLNGSTGTLTVTYSPVTYSGINVLTGDGIPNIVSGKGSTFYRVTGAGTSKSIYVNETGTATWRALGALADSATTATTLATPRAIYGNNFDGSAALTQIIASTYGGTGNGFTKFSGPTTAERTKTLRDASDTILELGGSYTPTGTWTSMTLVTPALGTPASGVVTNLTGTASININGTVGATTPAAGTFTTLVAGSTTSLLLGTAGSAVGNIGFRNATSGTITLAPPTGALGTVTLTLPAATDTLVGKATTDTLTNKTLTSPTLTTPTLGTPASGTLTNCTGLPVAGITASTSTALGVGSIELGHASDTTISRVSAGVIAVEGKTVGVTLGTESTTTGGSTIDFTGIPAGVSVIHVMFDGVQLSGTDDILIQIGDSGGIETTGYLGASTTASTVVASTNYTSGYGIRTGASASVQQGHITLTRQTGNKWSAEGVLARSNAAGTVLTAGCKTLSAELDRVRITVTGSNTFSANAGISISYE